jgi:hypothetical protein
MSEEAGKIRELYNEALQWCHCGDPEAALELMRDVLQLISDKNPGSFDEIYRELEEKLGLKEHRGLYWSYFYTLDAAGLLEHGGNVSGSWLTPFGEEILLALQSCNLDTVLDEETDWPDTIKTE